MGNITGFDTLSPAEEVAEHTASCAEPESTGRLARRLLVREPWTSTSCADAGIPSAPLPFRWGCCGHFRFKEQTGNRQKKIN